MESCRQQRQAVRRTAVRKSDADLDMEVRAFLQGLVHLNHIDLPPNRSFWRTYADYTIGESANFGFLSQMPNGLQSDGSSVYMLGLLEVIL